MRLNSRAPSRRGSILGEVAVPTDPEPSGVYSAAPAADGPQTLADLQTHPRMSRTAWLIAIMLFVAVLSFFIVVVCLGVDNS